MEAIFAPNIIIMHGGDAFPTVYIGANRARLRKYYYSTNIFCNGGIQIMKHPPAIDRNGGDTNYYHTESVDFIVLAGLDNNCL